MDKDRKIVLKALQEDLTIEFCDIELLDKAFLHSSYVNECMQESDSNERLELLGDSVLALIVNEYLYIKYSDRTEGELSKVKSVVVSEHSLACIAKKLSLGKYIMLGRGEKLAQGMQRAAILADTFEALLGAYYLDAGLHKARDFILPYIIDEVNKVHGNKHKKDYKTHLQQLLQQQVKLCPTYRTVLAEGPDHKRVFYIEVLLNEEVIGKGFGSNKKIAQQNAAEDALSKM